jgi:hypothetical protein
VAPFTPPHPDDRSDFARGARIALEVALLDDMIAAGAEDVPIVRLAVTFAVYVHRDAVTS